jgi:type I restriction enzyme S subunit
MSNKLSNLTTKQNQEKLEPKLRFPEFTDDLRKGIISDFGYFYYGKSCPKSSVSADGKTFCIRYGELYSKYGSEVKQIHSKTILNPSTLKLSKGGEVLVPRVGEDPLDFANTSFLPYKDVAIGEMISVYNTKENGLFISNYFNAKMKKPFARVVEGGNVSNLYFKYLESIKIFLPDKVEQEKIVTFINKIDKKIELLEDKLNSLKLFNIGVFQKYYNNTKFIKLKKISKLQGGFAFESKKYISSGIPIIKITNVEDEINFKNSNFSHYPNIQIDKKFKVDYNDILIAMSGATTGKIGRYKESQYSYLNQRVGKFIVNTKEINSEYFYHFLKSYYFKKELNKFLVAGAQPNISNNDIDNIKISLPDIITQNKIGSILQKIDTNIFLLNSKINKYKTFKKGLLQQMFI